MRNGAKMHAVKPSWEDGPPPGMFEDEPSRAAFKVWTPEEIFAPLPTPDYAVAGILLRGNVALVCATGASLKTWMTLALIIAMASGTKWLERFDCSKGPALFVDWESGDYELRRRLQRIANASGLRGAVDGVEFISMPDVNFGSPGFEAHITGLAKTRSLMVFDSLAAGSPGVDENDARFAHGLNMLKRVGQVTPCTFVVLHHSRKAKPDGGGDERESPRGTSAIFAACDVVLQLSRLDDGAFTVRQTKARGGRAVEPFVLRVDDHGDHATRVYAADPKPTRGPKRDAFEDAKATVLETIKAHPGISKRELRERVRARAATVDTALEVLIETRQVANLGDPKKGAFHAC